MRMSMLGRHRASAQRQDLMTGRQPHAEGSCGATPVDGGAAPVDVGAVSTSGRSFFPPRCAGCRDPATALSKALSILPLTMSTRAASSASAPATCTTMKNTSARSLLTARVSCRPMTEASRMAADGVSSNWGPVLGAVK